MSEFHEDLWRLVEKHAWRSRELHNETSSSEAAWAGECLTEILTRHQVPRPRVCGECGNCDEQGFCYPDPETVPFWVKEWREGRDNAQAMHCPCFGRTD